MQIFVCFRKNPLEMDFRQALLDTVDDFIKLLISLSIVNEPPGNL